MHEESKTPFPPVLKSIQSSSCDMSNLVKSSIQSVFFNFINSIILELSVLTVTGNVLTFSAPWGYKARSLYFTASVWFHVVVWDL